VSRPAVLAIDGGGSKIDAVLIDRDGAIAGSARVEPSGTDGQRAGDLAAIGLAVEAACRDARIDIDDLPVARLGVFCLAGADLPADDRQHDPRVANLFGRNLRQIAIDHHQVGELSRNQRSHPFLRE